MNKFGHIADHIAGFLGVIATLTLAYTMAYGNEILAWVARIVLIVAVVIPLFWRLVIPRLKARQTFPIKTA